MTIWPDFDHLGPSVGKSCCPSYWRCDRASWSRAAQTRSNGEIGVVLASAFSRDVGWRRPAAEAYDETHDCTRTSEVAVPTDIIFGDQDLTLDAGEARLHVKAADVALASGPRQSKPGLRRALVHSEQDALVLNFGGDYPAGVEIHGGRVTVRGLLFAGSPAADGTGSGVPGDHVVDEGEALPDIPGLDPPELDPDAIFGQLNHTAPLNIILELRLLRTAVLRLHERLKTLEGET